MSFEHPFRFLPGYRRLMRDGAQAEAIVVKCHANPVPNGGPHVFDLTLEVHLPGGTTTTIERREAYLDVGWVNVGDTLPMRYDAQRPERIEVDIPAWKAARAAGEDESAAAAIARARRRLPS